MFSNHSNKADIRILGRQLSSEHSEVRRPLSQDEIDNVAGGGPLSDTDQAGTDTHAGTCTNEADCD